MSKALRSFGPLLLAAVLVFGADVPRARAAQSWTFNFDQMPLYYSYPAAFPVSNFSGGAEVSGQSARSAPNSVMVYGNDNATTQSYGYYKIASVNILVKTNTWLEYFVQPLWSNGVFSAVDLKFNDGTYLRSSTAVDQYGVPIHAGWQGGSGHLSLNTYNKILSNIGAAVAGKTITEVIVAYDQWPNTGWTNAVFDDIVVFETGCGNGRIEAGEVCDDGNMVSGDGCSSTCTSLGCTATATTVRLAVNLVPNGKTVGGFGAFVDYPEAKVSLPGSGEGPASRVTGQPAGTSVVVNDKDNAVRVIVAGNTTLPSGRNFSIDFDRCSGAAAPTSGEFTCSVWSASSPQGSEISGVGCTAAIVAN